MYLSVSKDGEPAPALHTCGSGFPAWMLPFSHVPPPSRASARVFPPPTLFCCSRDGEESAEDGNQEVGFLHQEMLDSCVVVGSMVMKS